MPGNLSITSYGHCYHALIVSMLIKAGIQQEDSDMNSCFNFAEHLAFEIYHRRKLGEIFCEDRFREFLSDYRKTYYLKNATFNRMRGSEYGILTQDGQFKMSYIYYFFLGRFLAKSSASNKEELAHICENIHIDPNQLILLFVVHHTNDDEIVEEIALRTMCMLEGVEPATLEEKETRRFLQIVSMIPRNILSDRSVVEERRTERFGRDQSAVDEAGGEYNGESANEQWVVELYKVMKSNKVLGQIIRNKFGSLQRGKN